MKPKQIALLAVWIATAVLSSISTAQTVTAPIVATCPDPATIVSLAPIYDSQGNPVGEQETYQDGTVLYEDILDSSYTNTNCIPNEYQYTCPN